MQQAPYLTKGDSVTIISTARKISMVELKPAITLIESWGLKVKLGKHLFKAWNQFAGTSDERAEDLQTALNDANCKAIICARGGYGTVQIIDKIDFSTFREHPKWMVGYSDVTVLHSHINQNLGMETLHATMPIDIPNNIGEGVTESLRKALFGEELEYEFEVEPRSNRAVLNESAPIVGGNLSIIYSLTGTASQINCDGKFLFIEDLDEYLYHIDRMMMNLKRANLFNGCKGVLVGGMSDMNDNTIPFGKNAKEIIVENLDEYGIPVIFGIPAGHIKRNLSLIMGREVNLSINDKEGVLKFNGRA